MVGSSSNFTRWYDRSPELSQAVRMMEPLSSQWQRMIAQVIIDSVPTHKLTQRLEPGIKRIGREKVLGLMKSKGKQRWYDQDPVVHQAFNNLFLMDNALRRENALKIIISIRALEEIDQEGASSRQCQALLHNIFDKTLEELLEKTHVHLQSAASGLAETENTTEGIATATSSGPVGPIKVSDGSRLNGTHS